MAAMNESLDMFCLLTLESVEKSTALFKDSVKKTNEEEKFRKEENKREKHSTEHSKKPKQLIKKRPDPRLESGKGLPHHLGDYFPKKKFGGQMIEEIDPYFKNDRTFVVINNSKTIFRFSSTNAFFILSPFNPIRRAAIKILTHPMFSLFVLFTIIANCVFMARKINVEELEYTFTAIYTAESVIKAIARGLIINKFTYLRDPWNWLDFIVIGLAYLMFFWPALGKLTTLRSLRVLRALKTVTTIPGMKTVVGALLKAITQLRDVIVLTIFMLSIFALIGLQLYRGTLLKKCVKEFWNISEYNSMMDFNNSDTDFYYEQAKFFNNKSNWQEPLKICHNYTDTDWSSPCNPGYVCYKTDHHNPDFGYTSFDNFGFSLLCAFRLMTQDYWENLYQIIIRANGDIHIIYFMMVIFFGSFYLVNVILAIVAMSYDSVRQSDMAEDEEEEAAKKEEEEKREQLLEIIEKELDATSDDLIFQVLNEGGRNSEENLSIKSCCINSETEKINLKKRAQSFQWSAFSDTKVLSVGSDDEERMDSVYDMRHGSSKSITRTRRFTKYSLQSETNMSSKTSLNPKTSLTTINKSRYSSQVLPRAQRTITENSIDETMRSSQTSNLNLDEIDRLSNIVKDPELKRKLSMISIYETEHKTNRKKLFEKWFLATFCNWQCCPAYNVIKKIVGFIVLDPFMELYITICIVFNTFFMAIDSPLNESEMVYFLKCANYFFTATFTCEALMKLVAHGPREYFSDRWNIFDFIIVCLSLVEIPIDSKKMSLLRTFRLLRVFKLAKSWQTMNMLFTIIGRTLGAIGNLCIVLGIIIFIFAVVGMQIFGEKYADFTNKINYPDKNGLIPRWNFCDFIHSFMIVFRVLCGEYIESMWDCIQVNDFYCVPFFLLTMILANLVILNLFLALLLSSFGSESLQRREDETSDVNKIQEALDRIYRAGVWIKVQFVLAHKYLGKRVLRIIRRASGKCRYPEPWNLVLGGSKNDQNRNISLFNIDSSLKEWPDRSMQTPVAFNLWLETCEVKFDVDPEVNEAEIVYWNQPVECLPYTIDQILTKCCQCYLKSPLGRLWWWIRCSAFIIVDHKYFETFILLMIVLSSLTLTLEDKDLVHRRFLKILLEYLDKIFTVIFAIEMILKWFAIGLTKYFKDPWCWLDFVIVMIAVVSLVISLCGGGSNGIEALKAMRTLRALRPLRAVSRWEGMRIVVNALIQAIPSIFNVLLVCLVFWLIFSIIGMQLFGGKFFKCVYNGTNEKLSATLVFNKSQCLEFSNNVSWVNSKINFDNVLNGYLALFQVATFKGWMEIMSDAVDATELHQQPVYENNTYYYLYFVLFITFGSFFTLNLFIGVIIDNFNVQKKKVGGSLEMFMTEDQKKYYNAMKKMSSTAPQKPIPRPKIQIAQIFYNMITNQRFDLVIMGFIMLNTIVMCMEHHNQGENFKNVLDQINKVFILIFSGEAFMKLVALRWYYFKIGWNIFDFVIVVFSLIFWMVESLSHGLPISPTLVRVVRVFRIGRVLRLIKSARGIRTLLFSLIVSLPALFNIALLLMMIMFIYAIVGMSFFSKVPYYSGIDETFNFGTFGKSIIILFQISTSGGWNYVLDGLTYDNSTECADNPENCKSNLKAVIYLVSYLVISFLVIVNMYIAVILENFSQATNDVQQGLTQDDYDLFYECWENYDVDAVGFIHLKDLYELVDKIGKPLGIPKPNKIQLAMLEIPICKGDTIFCVDLLDILTKNFLGNINFASDTIIDLKPKGKIDLTKDKIVISNTYKLQQENWAAYKITYILRQFIKRIKEKRRKHIESEHKQN